MRFPYAMFKAAAIETHQFTTCRGCKVSPIRGVLYKCVQCQDYDLCESCKKARIHKSHSFFPVKSEEARVTQSSALCNPWETNRELVKFSDKCEIGRGYFGKVYKGLWKNHPVAIKTLHSSMNVQDFLAEAAIMATLKHNNVMTLLAVVTRQEPVMIITEFMDQGSLLDFLRRNDRKLPMKTLIWIALEVADGMKYLEFKNYVHRDLAARNVLVGTGDNGEITIKICDFGLTRVLSQQHKTPSLVYKSAGNIFSLRWTAPEAMPPEKNFTVKSDVWSYGILLTEIVTFGCNPYNSVRDEDIPKVIKSGKIMKCPDGCSQNLYWIMRKTWSLNIYDRPSFHEILLLLLASFRVS